MKNFVQPGNVIEVPSASAAVDSGQVVVIGAHIAIANHGAEIGEPYNATLDGVYEVPKVAGSAWTLGLPLMWDASAAAFTVVGTPATGDVTAGGATAFVAALSAATTGYVRLAGIPGTVA